MGDLLNVSYEHQGAESELCPIVVPYLPYLALDELRPKLAQAVRAHLERCASCRNEMARYDAVTQYLRSRLGGSERHDPGAMQALSARCSFESFLWSDATGVGDNALSLQRFLSEETGPNSWGAIEFATERSSAFSLDFEAAEMHERRARRPRVVRMRAKINGEAQQESPGDRNAPPETFEASLGDLLEAIAQCWHDEDVEFPAR